MSQKAPVPAGALAQPTKRRPPLTVWLLDGPACPEYDEFVGQHPQASVYHTRAWRDWLVARGMGAPRYLLALRGDEPVGVLPLFETRRAGRLCLLSLPDTPAAGLLAADAEVEFMLRVRAARLAEGRQVSDGRRSQRRGVRRREAEGNPAEGPLARLFVPATVAERGQWSTPGWMRVPAEHVARLSRYRRRSADTLRIMEVAAEQGLKPAREGVGSCDGGQACLTPGACEFHAAIAEDYAGRTDGSIWWFEHSERVHAGPAGSFCREAHVLRIEDPAGRATPSLLQTIAAKLMEGGRPAAALVLPLPAADCDWAAALLDSTATEVSIERPLAVQSAFRAS